MIIGRSDTTTLRASRYRLFGKRGAWSTEQRARSWEGGGDQWTV